MLQTYNAQKPTPASRCYSSPSTVSVVDEQCLCAINSSDDFCRRITSFFFKTQKSTYHYNTFSNIITMPVTPLYDSQQVRLFHCFVLWAQQANTNPKTSWPRKTEIEANFNTWVPATIMLLRGCAAQPVTDSDNETNLLLWLHLSLFSFLCESSLQQYIGNVRDVAHEV